MPLKTQGKEEAVEEETFNRKKEKEEVCDERWRNTERHDNAHTFARRSSGGNCSPILSKLLRKGSFRNDLQKDDEVFIEAQLKLC